MKSSVYSKCLKSVLLITGCALFLNFLGLGFVSAAHASGVTVAIPAASVKVGSGATEAVPGFIISGSITSPVTIRIQAANGNLAVPAFLGVTDSPSSTSHDVTLTGSEADVNSALRGLTYQRNTSGADTITVDVLGLNQFTCPVTGHVYQVVTGSHDWASAFADSGTMFNGHGYLATVTSASENDCVHAGVNTFSGDGRNAWIGARLVAGQVSNWEWADGPEAGTVFWTGGHDGTAAAGQYSNWDRVDVQPAGASNQACGQYYNSGLALPTWHDNGCEVGNKFVAEVDQTFAANPTGSVQVDALPALIPSAQADALPGSTPPAAATLAATGSETAIPMTIAGLLLTVGVAAIGIVRVRRRSGTEQVG